MSGFDHKGEAMVDHRLEEFCVRLHLPPGTVNELMKYLEVKDRVGRVKAGKLSPSSKMDELLHAILLHTEVRKSVEELVGEIHHSEAPAGLTDELKAERRW